MKKITMIKKSNLLFTLLFVMFSSIATAQFGGDPGTPGDTDPGSTTNDEPAAPIDNYVWIGLIMGVGIAAYSFKKEVSLK